MAIRVRWWWAFAGLVLVAALGATLFAGMKWTGFDFVAAAALLGTAGLGLEFVVRGARGPWRWVAGAVVVGLVALVWVDGAVGLF